MKYLDIICLYIGLIILLIGFYCFPNEKEVIIERRCNIVAVWKLKDGAHLYTCKELEQ